jgi:WD40 repeat protein
MSMCAAEILSATKLHDAASVGDTEEVKSLLQRKVEVDSIGSSRQTPLHVAAAAGHVSIVRLLLAAGACPNRLDAQNYTPLHSAALQGHIRVVMCLLALGNTLTPLGRTLRKLRFAPQPGSSTAHAASSAAAPSVECEPVLGSRWSIYSLLMQRWFEQLASGLQESRDAVGLNRIIDVYATASTTAAFKLFMQDVLTDTKFVPSALLGSDLFKRSEQSFYDFSDESFKDFFIAKHLLHELERAVSYSPYQQAEAWNQRMISDHPAVLTFLTEAVALSTYEARIIACLNTWVVLKSSKAAALSSNAVSLLVSLGQSFANTDLGGTFLRGANLAGGLFERANFSGADCRGANFSQTWLREANFTGTNLKGVRLGRQSKIKLNGCPEAVCLKPSGELQVATVDADKICVYVAATGQLLATLVGHTDYVHCLAYRADGRFLASGSYDHTLHVWDLDSRRVVRTFKTQGDWIRNLAYRADGHQLACSTDGLIILCRLADSSMTVLEGHTADVGCLSYRSDSGQLASGGWDNTIRLWDANNASLEAVLYGHTGDVHCLIYRADGKQLASGSGDCTIRLWDLRERVVEAVLEGHTDEVMSLCYRGDGLVLISGSADSTVRVWDLNNYGALFTLEGHSCWVTCLAYSSDAQQLISSAEGESITWDLKNRLAEAKLNGHNDIVRCLAYCPSMQLLVSGSDDNTIRLWDIDSGCATEIITGHGSDVVSLAFRPDGCQLASGSHDKTIRLWDPRCGQTEAILEGHTFSVCSLAYRPDGRQLASGSDDKTVRLWDIDSGRLQQTLRGHGGSVQCLDYHPNGRQLAAGSYNGSIRLWDLERTRVEAILLGHSSGILCLAYRDDGHQLASGAYDSTIRLWSLSTQRAEVALVGHRNRVHCLAYRGFRDQLVSGSDDKTWRIWDIKTYQCLWVFEVMYPVMALAWQADSLSLGCGKEVLHWCTPKDSEPNAWYLRWRAALNPALNCHNMQVLGASIDAMSRQLLLQQGAVDTIAAQTSTPQAAFASSS